MLSTKNQHFQERLDQEFSVKVNILKISILKVFQITFVSSIVNICNENPFL